MAENNRFPISNPVKLGETGAEPTAHRHATGFIRGECKGDIREEENARVIRETFVKRRE
jgi:hypothetical protein